MRPHPALAAAVATAAAALVAAGPATAATWTAPATVSAPHTFVNGLEAASSGDGTVVSDWRFQDGVGNGATTGARDASLAPGAATFGGERTLPGATTQVVPYAQRSVAALLQANLDTAGRRVRLSVAFGSATGPSLGTARSVVVDDVAFVPRLAMGTDGSGVLAWVARTSGARRVVKVSLRAPGGRFGAPSIISGTGRANTITAAVGPQGQRVVAFERGGRLLARYRPANGSWGPIQDLGAVAAGTDNEVAALITSGGRAMLADVHRQLSEGGDAGPLLVDAWVRPVGATRFGVRQRLDQADGVQASAPALVQGDGRGAVLAWAGSDPGAPPTPNGASSRVRVSVTGADGRFGAAQPLSPAAQPVTGVGAAGNGGATVVSWVRIAAGSDVSGQVFAALRPVGGAFGAPEAVSPDEHAASTAPSFTRTPDNRPLVLWTARPGGEGPGVPLASIQTFVRTAQRQP
jgi:hypothetical protein